METPQEDHTTLGLVTSAARTAAMQVLDSPAIRRRQYKLVALACALSVVLVLTIALPTAYFLDRDRQRAAVERARFNCDQQTQAVAIQRDILRIGADLRRDNRELGRDPRVRQAVREVFGRELVVRLYAKQQEHERVAAVKFGQKLRQLRELARLDCVEVLDGTGANTTDTDPPRIKTSTNPRVR